MACPRLPFGHDVRLVGTRHLFFELLLSTTTHHPLPPTLRFDWDRTGKGSEFDEVSLAHTSAANPQNK